MSELAVGLQDKLGHGVETHVLGTVARIVMMLARFGSSDTHWSRSLTRSRQTTQPCLGFLAKPGKGGVELGQVVDKASEKVFDMRY